MWTDDKEQELFEAQETIAELLEVLGRIQGNAISGKTSTKDKHSMFHYILTDATEAIRKAKIVLLKAETEAALKAFDAIDKAKGE